MLIYQRVATPIYVQILLLSVKMDGFLSTRHFASQCSPI